MAQAASRREASEPVHLTKTDKKWVAATLRSLSLEEKVGAGEVEEVEAVSVSAISEAERGKNGAGKNYEL